MTAACTMYGVWRRGQERMLEVYRASKLDSLAMPHGSAGLSSLRIPEAVGA